MQDLTGKVVLITGGGAGLGAATAECLAEAGCRVVVADLQREPAVGTARRLRDAGQDASALSIDVADQRQSRQGIERVLDHYGRLDVLVNNADTDATLSIEDLEVEQWDRVMGVTLRGAFLMSKAAFPIMREQGGGAVVNICSTAAKRCWANASAHHASNWGLLGFSHALHVEGRAVGIKVTAVITGGMATPSLLDRIPDIDTTLQDPANVAETIRFVLSLPNETVIPEVMVIPMKESSWP